MLNQLQGTTFMVLLLVLLTKAVDFKSVRNRVNCLWFIKMSTNYFFVLKENYLRAQESLYFQESM